MSEPTPRELTAQEIMSMYVYNEKYAASGYGASEFYALLSNPERKVVQSCVASVTHAEVLAVLDELVEQAKVTNYRASNGEIMKEYDIPLSAITQLKQRYGGKPE